MRVTFFELDDDSVRPGVSAEPPWEPFKEYDGEPLTDVDVVGLDTSERAELQLVRIRAGGHFVMHSSPHLAFCQIVSGRGRLRLPDGRSLDYEGPELYVFRPDTLHEWYDVAEDTLLSVCIVRLT
jgi:quercetin dioxygenase-like cupin family protein